MGTTGIKYSKHLDTAEVAKLVRSDIKAAQKSGALPKSLKVSVQISRYSGGSSLTITIKSAPVRIHRAEYVEHEVRTGGRVYFAGHRYTERARALMDALEDIAGQYHRDNSDAMQDVYNVNFSLSVGFASSLAREDLEIQREYYAALVDAERAAA